MTPALSIYPSVSTTVLLTAAVLGLLVIRKIRVRSWGYCKNKRSLSGQVVVITGANSGLGKATAIELVARGAHVVLACRDLEKADETVMDILRIVSTCTLSNLSVLKLDLSSLKSVRNFVKEFEQKHDHLNILINNAGVMGCEFSLTNDNTETQMAVNHYAPFLLTNLLIKDLKKCVSSRIIFVTSTLARNGKISLECKGDSHYDKRRAYANSKLANFIFALELNKRLNPADGIGIYLVSPGLVWTKLGRHMQPPWWKLLFILPVLIPLAYLFVRSSSQGCQSIVHCAVEEQLVSGGFYKDCRKSDIPKNILNHDNIALSLWNHSQEITMAENLVL